MLPFLGRRFPSSPEAEVLDVTTSEGEFHGDLLPIDVRRQRHACPANFPGEYSGDLKMNHVRKAIGSNIPKFYVFLAMLMA